MTTPSIFVLFTDPLGVTDIGGTLAKHSKAGAKVVAVVLWEYPDDVEANQENGFNPAY